MKLNLTKTAVDGLPNPDKGQVFYYDTKLQGFGVYAMKTCKTYFAEGRVKGKTVRVNIGRHGVFLPDKARDEARELLVRMSKGENPNEVRSSSLTLRSAVSAYLKERTSGQGKTIKEKTKDGYQWLLDVPLKPWSDTNLSDIDEAWVRKVHKKITEDRGPVCANNALRMTRAVLTFNDVVPNPVHVLAKKKLWNPDKRRSGFIASDDVADWIKAAEKLDVVMRGVVLTLLLLGLRKMEALTLEKKQYRDGQIVLEETKNGDQHIIPVGPYLAERLDALLKLDGKWLFPSAKSKSGHVQDPRDAIAALGLKVSAHDLRRTFVSHLNALDPAPSTYTIKRLMNHRQGASDVTAGYIQIEEKKLREVIVRLESAMVGTA